MASGNFVVLFDANVLYPAPLRDFLVRLAGSSGLFKGKWSDDIHDEWTRNLQLQRRDLDFSKINRTRELMNRFVADSLIVRQ